MQNQNRFVNAPQNMYHQQQRFINQSQMNNQQYNTPLNQQQQQPRYGMNTGTAQYTPSGYGQISSNQNLTDMLFTNNQNQMQQNPQQQDQMAPHDQLNKVCENL